MTPVDKCFNRDGELESVGLLDLCDEEAGREENSSPTFHLQRHVSQKEQFCCFDKLEAGRCKIGSCMLRYREVIIQ